MKITNSKIIHEIRPQNDNPRNSEGAFMQLKDGRIMFAYSRFQGSSWNDDAPSNIAAVYLNGDGNDMCRSEPETLVSADEYENVKNIMSVSLMRMANGDLGLFYLVKRDDIIADNYGRRPTICDYILRRSNDDCSFRRDTEVLCSSKRFRGYYVVNNNRVLRTRSGRLIAPASLHRGSYVNNNHLSFDGVGTGYIFYSDDDGYTWNDFNGGITLPSSARSATGMQEPGVIELPDGTVYLYARTDRMFQYESFSPDSGVTWSPAQPSGFTSPASPMKIERNPYNNMYYSVWNPIPNYNGRDISHNWGRTPLVIAESSDGLRYSDYFVIEDDINRGFCYPAIYFLDDKNILLSYCCGGESDGCCLCITTIRKITLE